MFESTVSLTEDGIEEAQEKIDELESAKEELESFAEEEYEHEALRPERLQNQIEQYEQEIENNQGRINIFEKILEEWEGDEFSIRMLKGNELAQLQDGSDELSGEQSIEVLQKAVTSSPEGSPTEDGSPDPGEYAWPVTMWLFQKVNSLNGTGDPNFMDGGPL